MPHTDCGMKLISGPKKVHVVLSKRNLLSLLAKLHQAGSLQSIFSLQDDQSILIVTGEDDAKHYAHRTPPGPVSPETEAILKEIAAHEEHLPD